ncbi:MAG TPA: RluA family pseudouridine synthase [Polyangiaceae bacterium]
MRFVLAAGSPPERVDKALARLLPGISRSTIQRWMSEGRVLVGGTPCRPRDSVAEGSVLDVDPGPAPASAAEPDPSVVIEVLYEDAELVVVNKPAGLVVHPARGHRHGTLVNGLLARPGFVSAPADARDRSGALRPGIVHRIDKDTSGILVVAKTARARESLKAALSAHDVERRYVALTLGVPRAKTIRTTYGRDRRSRLRFTSKLREGKPAVTHVSVLETFAARAALVECRLETGRTHQIRVHLSEQARTPLLGDVLYGRTPNDPELAAIAATLGRQALHAAELGFAHPVSGAMLRFEAPPPADFRVALEALRALGRR